MRRLVRVSLLEASFLCGWICGEGRVGLQELRRESLRRDRLGFGLGVVLLGVYECARSSSAYSAIRGMHSTAVMGCK